LFCLWPRGPRASCNPGWNTLYVKRALHFPVLSGARKNTARMWICTRKLKNKQAEN
jgi:hypothetical protein